MSAIAASNVTYTLPAKGSVSDSGSKIKIMTIAFGNGTLTYPATGVPLSGLSSKGFPTSISKVELLSPAPSDGIMYKYDNVNNSIRIYLSPAVAALGPLTEATTAYTPAATTMQIEVVGF